MKKLLFGLSAILLCFMMASCNNDPISKLKSISKDIEKNGNDWTDAEKWDEVMTEAFNTIIEFADSDPSKEELEEFSETIEELETAIDEIDDKKAKKALDKAKDKFDKDLFKEERKAIKKLKKLSKKYDKDDDDDDSDDDED